MKILVTGSGGLVGSEVVTYFDRLGWEVHGIDNNMRADFFGTQGDTRWNQRRLEESCKNFTHHEVDIRNRAGVLAAVEHIRPELIVHAAAQPSHDLAAKRPFDDFDTNAGGTFNMLEATRLYVPDSVFVQLSTNKVYGDAPNELPLKELDTRWEYARPEDYDGIDESMRIDQSKHSLFGVSKVAADVAVQEYGRYFGMKTCCLRCGCITGGSHSGVELHGFLSYLIKVNVMGGLYNIYGYKGKQVRDNIHAHDLARFVEAFYHAPRSGEIYNMGGGRENSCSIIEAFNTIQQLSGKPMKSEYFDKNREGDHICYISNLAKVRAHYPDWDISWKLPAIFEDIYRAWQTRL